MIKNKQKDKYSPTSFYSWFNNIPVLLVFSLISSLIKVCILLWAAKKNNLRKRLNVWALHLVTYFELMKWSAVALIFFCISTLIGEALNLQTENFMTNLKLANSSLAILTLVIITVCLVVPITEELIFRGWLYSNLKNTKLGNVGAIIITSFIFTVIHTQYSNTATLLYIFSDGLLLGFVRYKTQNTSYTIIIHILFNSIITAKAFYF